MLTATTTSSSSRQCITGTPLRQCPALTIRPDRRYVVQAENRRPQDTGYLKEDSAGQENIFAVEAKSFVAGSSKDTASNPTANAAIAGVAIAIAAVAISAGVFLTKDKAEVNPAKILEEAPTESLSSIAERLKPAVQKAVEQTPAAPALSSAT